MVKPIPAIMPTPNISFHLTPVGRLQIFNLTDKNVNNVIPRGFPNTKPNIIPIL